MERCRPDHHHSETERSQRREPCGDADRARKDQSERCHDLRPRGDRPFDRNVLFGEYLLQSGRREQMQHRMQHEERGKQNLQDPQSNVHCMISFSTSRTKMLQLASMVAKGVRPLVAAMALEVFDL